MQEYEPPHMRGILYTVSQKSDIINVFKWKSDTQNNTDPLYRMSVI